MRFVIEFDSQREDDTQTVKLPVDAASETSSVDDKSPAWKYAILTSLLVVCIVVQPISTFIESQPIVQSIQRKVNPQPTNNLASRVYQAMQRKGYKLSQNPEQVNIIYIRGADQFGRPNGNRINEWSDRRFILQFRSGNPVIVGNWAATVKPGLPAIRNPLGKEGAAFAENGQYSAWRVGIHHGIFGRVEEGLVQVLPVKFRRDTSRNGRVDDGERLQSGNIGLNQHSGSNQLKVDKASYACFAAQSQDGHRQFLSIVKSDRRYRLNSNYIFATTILDVNDL